MRGGGWYRGCWPLASTPKGYTYVGPFRCGSGPHALYRDPSGRALHAWDLYRWGMPPVNRTQEDMEAELDLLRQERSHLEERIKELEKQLKDKQEKA